MYNYQNVAKLEQLWSWDDWLLLRPAICGSNPTHFENKEKRLTIRMTFKLFEKPFISLLERFL